MQVRVERSIALQINRFQVLVALATLSVVSVGVWSDSLPFIVLLAAALVMGLAIFAVAVARPVYSFYFLFFLIPFSQSIPTIQGAGRTLNIGFDTIVIGIILLAYAVRAVAVGKLVFLPHKAAIVLLAWWVWNLGMLGLTTVRLSGTPVVDALIVFLRWSQYVPVFLVILHTDMRPGQAKTFVRICVVAALLMGSVNLLEELIIGVDRTQIRGTGLVTRGLFTGEGANYNVGAAYTMIGLLLLTPFALTAPKARKRLGLLAIGFLLASIWVTTSRSGLLGAFIGLVFLGLFYFPRTLVCYTAASLPLAGVVLWHLKDSMIVTKLLELRYIPQALPMLVGKSIESLGLPHRALGGVARFSRWGEALLLFYQSPLWGNGFRATRWSRGPTGYFTADNYYLETMADTGIVGLALALMFLGVLYACAIRLFKLSKDNVDLRAFAVGYQGALVAVVFVNIFAGMFMSQKIWGTFLVLSAVLCNQLRAKAQTARGI